MSLWVQNVDLSALPGGGWMVDNYDPTSEVLPEDQRIHGVGVPQPAARRISASGTARLAENRTFARGAAQPAQHHVHVRLLSAEQVRHRAAIYDAWHSRLPLPPPLRAPPRSESARYQLLRRQGQVRRRGRRNPRGNLIVSSSVLLSLPMLSRSAS